MKLRYVLITSAIFFLISCSNTKPEKSLTLEIQGIVTDSTDGSPISGAGVILYKITGWETSKNLAYTFTDNNGFYYLEYTFTIADDCNESLMHMNVGENLMREMQYYSAYISDFQNPHVRCIEGVQIIDVQLDPWQ